MLLDLFKKRVADTPGGDSPNAEDYDDAAEEAYIDMLLEEEEDEYDEFEDDAF